MSSAQIGTNSGTPKSVKDYVARASRAMTAKLSDYKDCIKEASQMTAARKMQENRLKEIQIGEIAEWFEVLSNGKHGQVPFEVISQVLTNELECSEVEIDVVQQHMKVLPGGIITAEQFYYGINVTSVQTLLKQVYADKMRRRDDAYYSKKRNSYDIQHEQVERSFFVDRVVWRVNRDDAFATLPLTGLYLILFMILVVYHLQIWRRQELERGIEAWIDNQAENYYGPYFKDHVYSAASFGLWLNSSGLPGILGDVRNSSGIEVRLGITNIVVGDLLLKQRHGENYEYKEIWLINGKPGLEYLANHPHENPPNYAQAARATSNWALDSKNGWVGDSTKELELQICTYNNQGEMYGITDILVPLDRYGFVRPRIKAKTVLIFAYPNKAVIIADALYIFLMVYIMYIELKDMCGAIRLGWHEFIDYWTPWNSVDWTAIFLGFVNIALWIYCIIVMGASSLHDPLNDDNKMKSNKNLMDLKPSQLVTMHDDLKAVAFSFFLLHIAVALTTIFVVVRFFKAFQANPRLQTVTMTLAVVATDVFHFFFVFMTIFASFAVIGHVLFGSDITKFYTLASSFNTGLTVLMGEFDWYVDLTTSPDTLPSGMPRIFLTLWFVIYMFFVLLVMLNMLLAIILERYSEVAYALSTRSDARTLPQQTRRFVRRMLETRGFIPLMKIRHELENDADPAHKPAVVTKDSLKDAFPGMKDGQAAWIMQFLITELKEQSLGTKDDEAANRSKRTERFVQSIAEELHTIGAAVSDCKDRMTRLEVLAKAETGRPNSRPMQDQGQAAWLTTHKVQAANGDRTEAPHTSMASVAASDGFSAMSSMTASTIGSEPISPELMKQLAGEEKETAKI